ncbi:MAG: DUF4372 domain-containing protein, partial [Victivallales bacterium]|nr:DUF4372 domain-containing protein [Victivallales bacterium]
MGNNVPFPLGKFQSQILFFYVFAQVVEFLDYFKFRRLVEKYRGDAYVKHFSCWHQLLTLMFGQLSG